MMIRHVFYLKIIKKKNKIKIKYVGYFCGKLHKLQGTWLSDAILTSFYYLNAKSHLMTYNHT